MDHEQAISAEAHLAGRSLHAQKALMEFLLPGKLDS